VWLRTQKRNLYNVTYATGCWFLGQFVGLTVLSDLQTRPLSLRISENRMTEDGISRIPPLRSGLTDQIRVVKERDIGHSRQTALASGAWD
jgi:hypothetical protein